MNSTALNRQNLLDIAVQEYGNALAVFELAEENNLSITADLETGKRLELPESENTDPEILKFYKEREIKPATAITQYIPGIDYGLPEIFPIILP